MTAPVHDRTAGGGAGGGPPADRSNEPVSRTGATTLTTRLGSRQATVLVGALVALVVAVLLIGPGAEPGLPLDPTSAAPDGLAGVVDLLEEVGVQVDIATDLPTDTSTRVFVPVDQLTTERRDEVRDFMARGGTVVVAGAAAPLHGLTPVGSPISDLFGATTREPRCAELPEVDTVDHGDWSAMELPADATGCFPTDDGEGAWLVIDPRGAGQLIAIGSAGPLTNRELGAADNAVLAAAVLGPEEGDELVIIPRPEVGEGETPLLELVPPGVWRGLALLLAAVVAFTLWRGRRLGPPVAERLPPVLPSAELARSVAGLLQRAGDRDAAASRLRDDLRLEVGRSLGVPHDTPPGRLAELTATRTAAGADDAHLALVDAPVGDDGALTDLAAAVVRVREAHRRPAAGSPSTDLPTTSP